MSDLISREEAIERLEILRRFNAEEALQIAIDAAEEQINRCEVAFNKEKVIEALIFEAEASRKYWRDYHKETTFGEIGAYTDAIEIVEKGGLE